MSINEIRDHIAISLNLHCDDKWWSILDDATPGNYGVEDLEFEIGITSIWVNVPDRTFTFKDGTLSFSARLLASSPEHGVDVKVRKTLSGAGKFDFTGNKVQVSDFKINEPIDLLE